MLSAPPKVGFELSVVYCGKPIHESLPPTNKRPPSKKKQKQTLITRGNGLVGKNCSSVLRSLGQTHLRVKGQGATYRVFPVMVVRFSSVAALCATSGLAYVTTAAPGVRAESPKEKRRALGVGSADYYFIYLSIFLGGGGEGGVNLHVFTQSRHILSIHS